MIFSASAVDAAIRHVEAVINNAVTLGGIPQQRAYANHVGSSYTNNGEGADLDVILYVPNRTADRDDVRYRLEGAGYTYTGGTDEYGGMNEDDFMTFRKGDVNVIYTDDIDFHCDMRNCSEVVKYLVKQGYAITKEQRIGIHRIVMNGEDA